MEQQEWNELMQELEAKRLQIEVEIESYPAPIPACDQQFNYLLEQRGLVRQELRQLRERKRVSAE